MKKSFITIAFFFIIWGGVYAQGNLQFNQVKIISSTTETVPAGKVWKIVNIFAPQILRFQASSGSGGCSGSCNGSSTTWNSFTTPSCPDQSTFNSSAQIRINGSSVFFNPNSPIWLPASTQLQGNSFSCNNSAGWYTGNPSGVNYSCHCPPAQVQTVFTNISVIEFNIIP